MSAIKKEELERLEREHGLEPDGLSYQLRCSRITAVLKGEEWEAPKETAKPRRQSIKDSPLYGKRILITPMMVPDKNRAIYYEEDLGPELEVREFNAGEAIYNAGEDVKRVVGDYEILGVSKTKHTIAKTNIPKIGTEISWLIGKELCPVVRGNSGERGYVWSLPTHCIKVGDTLVQVYGLKTLIRQTYPELEPKFSGKPLMSYIDGITLAANIPQTHALLKEHVRQEQLAAKAGLTGFGF